jgi:transketolase
MIPLTNKLAADDLRLNVLDMALAAGSGHIGGSFSCAEILAVLYREVLRVDPRNPRWPDRDRLVLSKGHAAPMLYACLAERGFFEKSLLTTLRELNSPLQGHPCMFKLPGVDMSTGSLGMGLSVGVGTALALRARGSDARVYVLLGDGELQEGMNWEAVMSLKRWGLDALTPIVDLNGVQLDGTTQEIQPGQSDMMSKLRGFGLKVMECDGHDPASIREALDWARSAGAPHAIVAHTVKGKGVSFMEGKAAWHGKPITKEEYDAARAEIEGRRT